MKKMLADFIVTRVTEPVKGASIWSTVKFLNFRMPKKLCCNLPIIQTKRPNLRVFCQNDACDIANIEDPDQTAMFAQTCLSKILGSLRKLYNNQTNHTE